ncbi:restriction endonuclease subunit S [Helicobacter pylori]|uniref:restriction endonuclease subunit S n=1 Tax=Helicobacter pylori TaxID=210 RepID=UPI002711DE4F|nr:restriction endonuclease subunit S [Helicobacter pylori]MDO7820861.1 restriction endonuclease subunit S [Helicobacter pylori]MDO7822914.1 restriction endonuclease subunit S [Helicobacter pylori]
MIGPLSSQLNAIKWGEFKLGDLFEASNGDFDIQKRHINHRGEFVITAGLSNNGVLGQSDIKAKVFESHTITIDMFGCAFYRSFAYKMVTHARVFSLKPKFEINHKIGLFLSTLFFGYPKKFGYENMCSWVKIKNDKVILPLKPTANAQTLKDIDFDFMETFIAELEQCRLAELEQCRLAELEAYLKATGLSNTTLSNDEENALDLFNDKNSGGGNTPCGLTWQSFKLGDLFEIRPTKAYKLTNSHLFDSNAKNPVVTNSSLNNGISGYSSLEPTEKGNQITYSDTTTSEGIFYQKRPFIGYSHVQGLYSLKYHEFWNEKTLLYIVTAFKKVACGRFNYGNKFNRKIASGMPIILPTNQHGEIDFHFMRTFINALMKQTIQGVVQYSSAKIQATKEAISQETPTQKDSLF